MHGAADLLERDTGVEQALDHLEDQDVAEAVQALGAGAVSPADAGLDQASSGPVVELAVGDAGRAAGRRTAVTGPGLVGLIEAERRSSFLGLLTRVKQCALLLGVRDSCSAAIRRLVIAPGSRHAHLHRELTTLGTRLKPY